MAEAKHTPGPWAFRLRTAPRVVRLKRTHWEVGAPNGFGVAIVFGDSDTHARLISAAPAMLDGLTEIERLCGCPDPDLKHIKKIAARLRSEALE